MPEPTLLEIIQATLAPMFLITGAGIYLNFVQTRLFRAVDRIRALEDLQEGDPKEGIEPPTGDKLAAIRREARFQLERIHKLRSGVMLGSTTMVFTATTAIVTILRFYLPGLQNALANAALFSFVGALVCLGASLVYGLQDTWMSIRSVESGIWAEAEQEPD